MCLIKQATVLSPLLSLGFRPQSPIPSDTAVLSLSLHHPLPLLIWTFLEWYRFYLGHNCSVIIGGDSLMVHVRVWCHSVSRIRLDIKFMKLRSKVMCSCFLPPWGICRIWAPPTHTKKVFFFAFPKQSTSVEGKRNHQRFWLSLRAGVTQLKTWGSLKCIVGWKMVKKLSQKLLKSRTEFQNLTAAEDKD